MDDSLNGTDQQDFKRRHPKPSTTTSPHVDHEDDNVDEDNINNELLDRKVSADDRKGLLEALKAADADAHLDDYLLDEDDDPEDDDANVRALLNTLTHNDDDGVVSGDVDDEDDVGGEDDEDEDEVPEDEVCFEDVLADDADTEVATDCASSGRGDVSVSTVGGGGGGGRPNEATAYMGELMAEKRLLAAAAAECPNAERFLDAEITKVQATARMPHRESKYVDIYREKPIRVVVKVLVPVKEHPKFNFVGKLLGPRGNSLKRLQEDTMCKMAVLGRGSMRDRNKEEELRSSNDPKYVHLHDELHVEISAQAPPAEAHARAAYALAEVRKYLIPDANDGIRQEQLRELIGDGAASGGQTVVDGEEPPSHHPHHPQHYYAPVPAASAHHYGGGQPRAAASPVPHHHHHPHHPHHHPHPHPYHPHHQSAAAAPAAPSSPAPGSAPMINPYARPRAIASAYAAAAAATGAGAAPQSQTQPRTMYQQQFFAPTRSTAPQPASTLVRSAIPAKQKVLSILDRARSAMSAANDAYEAADTYGSSASYHHHHAPHPHTHQHHAILAHPHTSHPSHAHYANSHSSSYHHSQHHHSVAGVYEGASPAPAAATPPSPPQRFDHSAQQYDTSYAPTRREYAGYRSAESVAVKHSPTSAPSPKSGYHHHHQVDPYRRAIAAGSAAAAARGGQPHQQYRSSPGRGLDRAAYAEHVAATRGGSGSPSSRGHHHYAHQLQQHQPHHQPHLAQHHLSLSPSSGGGEQHHYHPHQPYAAGGGGRYRSAPYSKPTK